MSLSATLRGDWNDYDAELGRRAYDTLGATVSWDWQPSPQTGFGAYAAWDRASVGIANINESAVAPDDPRLGGEVYAEAGRWWVDDNQRNQNAGFTFHQQLGRVRLDGGWNWMHSRGRTGYRYASPVALAWPDLAAQSGDAFPDMTYRIATFDVGLTFALGKRTSLRVFDRYERGRISDWHYSGLEQGLVIDHRVYLDAGPMNYSANLVGVMLEVRL